MVEAEIWQAFSLVEMLKLAFKIHTKSIEMAANSQLRWAFFQLEMAKHRDILYASQILY